MTGLVRPRTFFVPFLLALGAVLSLLISVAHAGTGAATGSDLPDVGASAARWYSDGRLALSVVLPAAVGGGLTWGGLIVALGTGGALVANGTAKEPTEDAGPDQVPL